jgi:glycosyltransferase involved in cell wall biosynthesis
MKVRIAHRGQGSGKSKFAQRLADQLSLMGVKIVEKRADVNLVIMKEDFVKGSKNILRVDGAWINTESSYQKQNAGRLKQMKAADGIVYQNDFCRAACNIFCGDPRKQYVCISNGVSPDEFHGVIPEHLDRPHFLAMCKWRPHKRLRDTVTGFLQSAMAATHYLVVLGDPDYVVKHPAVRYLKWQDGATINRLLVGCVATVHLAYIDWCPNSVVESLVAGKPVIHTRGGAVGGIVKSDGICIGDQPWDMKPLKLYEPPPLALSEVAKAYEQIGTVNVQVRPDLHIQTVARQYKEFFERIAKGN